jgi:hypothetical protein
MSLQESVGIELGGKRRALRYDFNALVALEEELKISIQDLGSLLGGSVRLKDLRAILWAGLIHEDAALTPKSVGALIGSPKEMAELGKAIRTAIEAAFPPSEPELTIPGRKRNGGSKN